MKIGMIGLGKMGGNMATRLLEKGHNILAFDTSKESVDKLKSFGAEGAYSLEEFVEKLNKEEKSIAWVMLPAGEITMNTLKILGEKLKKGSIIIDGGNSMYKTTIENSDMLKNMGHSMLDVGTSGGVWGLKNGYCLMIGGEKEVFEVVEPIFKSLAQEKGYEYMGSSGSGHFVKMVHNGIEYGMMQAYGEGFEILKAKKEFDLDLEKISSVWQHGSVVDSWLLDLAHNMFSKDQNLDEIKGYVQDSGEGRWTVLEALEQDVSAPIITLSLMQRFRSRKEETFTDKVLAGLRREFGGHDIKK